MSSYGTYSLSLRQERLDQLHRRQEEQRKQRVRQEATTSLASCRQKLGQFQHHLMQHFGHKAQDQSKRLAQQAEQLLHSDPDEALLLARKSLAAAERGLEEASLQTAIWTEEKADAQESIAVLGLALESLLKGVICIDGANEQLARAVQYLKEAKTALRREDFNGAKAAALKGQEQVRKSEHARHQAEEQEEVRREIVRGLREVLIGMGFTVEPPHLGKDSETGKVVLVGILPSGRTARFAISRAGLVNYDFAGYHHRQCAKDMKKIQHQLETHCLAKTSDTKTHWKEEQPLQIGKNALDFPIGQEDILS